jgi:[ribosomal protein S5]-alanine N-acetyltransferase
VNHQATGDQESVANSVITPVAAVTDRTILAPLPVGARGRKMQHPPTPSSVPIHATGLSSLTIPVNLTSERLTIRPWHSDDAPGLAAAADDIRIWRTVRDRFPHPYTLDAANEFIARQRAEAEATQHAIVVKGTIAGGIGWFPGIDIQRITAELGYWIAVPHWGTGLATAAVGLVATALFDTVPLLHRLFAIVADNNPASARVLERNGFVREAIMRKHALKDGVIGDSWLYARLRDDRPTD